MDLTACWRARRDSYTFSPFGASKPSWWKEMGEGEGGWRERERERERDRDRDRQTDRQFVCLFFGWLLNVPATGLCISGTDLLRQLYVLSL